MLRRAALAALALGLAVPVSAQTYRPGGVPGFRPGFQFLAAPLAVYDFAGGAYPAVTVTRSTTGLAEDTAGVFQSFAANTLRRTTKGALIEPSATMLVAASGDFTNAAWTKNRITPSLPGTTDQGLPTNRLTMTANSSTSFTLLQSRSKAAAPLAAFAQFVFKLSPDIGFAHVTLDGGSGANSVKVIANVGNGTIVSTTNAGTFTNATSWIRRLGTSDYHVLMLSGLTGSETAIRSQIAFSKLNSTVTTTYAGTEAIDALAFQLEAGAASSIYPVAAAGTVREADVATVTVPAGAATARLEFGDEAGIDVAVTAGSTFTIPSAAGRYVTRLEMRP